MSGPLRPSRNSWKSEEPDRTPWKPKGISKVSEMSGLQTLEGIPGKVKGLAEHPENQKVLKWFGNRIDRYHDLQFANAKKKAATYNEKIL